MPVEIADHQDNGWPERAEDFGEVIVTYDGLPVAQADCQRGTVLRTTRTWAGSIKIGHCFAILRQPGANTVQR